MELINEIKETYQGFGAHPDVVEYVGAMASTLISDAEGFYSSFPNLVLGMLNESPATMVQKGHFPVELETASNNFVVYKAYCEIVRTQLESKTKALLQALAFHIHDLCDTDEEIGTTLKDSLVEGITGGLGSLHPSVDIPIGLVTFLNTPLALPYPDAFAELIVITLDAREDLQN